MKKIKTVGRRRLVVRHEGGNVKIDILLKDKRIATLDLEPSEAGDLELAVHEHRVLAKKSK